MVQPRRIQVAVRLPGRKNSGIRTPGEGRGGSDPGSAGFGRVDTLGQVKDQTGEPTGRRAAQNGEMQEIGCRFACTLA